jgi:uncharacterized protein YycO
MENCSKKIGRSLKKKIFFGVFLLVGASFLMIFNQQKRHEKKLPLVQEHEIRALLNDGDIICRLGNRPWSYFFRELSPIEKKFSHLGIVRIRDGVMSVINAEGLAIEGKDFVNEVSLKEFLKIAKSTGIYRLQNIQGEKISDTALEYKGRPFDWQFDMEEDDKLYCSELLYAVLKKLDSNMALHTVWAKEIEKNIIPLDVCSQTEYFLEVGYWEN